MAYNRANYIRIREEFADKNLRAKKAAEERARGAAREVPGCRRDGQGSVRDGAQDIRRVDEGLGRA